MRKLMWITIGFALACGLGVLTMGEGWLLPAVFAAVPSLLLCHRFHLRRPAMVILGFGVGLIWFLGFYRLYLLPAQILDGTTIETTVTARDYSYHTGYGVGVDGEFTLEAKKYRIRLYVNSAEEIRPGDEITGSFRLRYNGPGGMEESTHHAGEGILFLGYERRCVQIRRTIRDRGLDLGSRLHHHIAQRLTELFPRDVEALARALLLGDDFDLDYETDTALRLSGIRHIVAVSGLHVAILYTMLRIVSLNKRFLTALLGIPVLILFCAVAGFTPSVTRACIMVGLMILSQLLNREYDSPTALAFAALVMLAWNPLVITSISFQMSIGCVTGILLFYNRIYRWLAGRLGLVVNKTLKGRLSHWFVSSVSISLSSMVLTTPMSAIYFGTVSLVGVLTNLLTLWAVGLAFYGITAVVILSLISMNAAAWLAALAALPMRYVVFAAKLLAEFPLAAVYTQSVYIVIWLVFVYVLLGVFTFIPERRPRVLMCCAVLSLCAALLVSWTEHRFSSVHLTALDVGQGQCLILHTEGKTYLIDCGGNNDEIAANTAADTLLSRGVTKLDGIILTHGDRDHAGGIPYLLTRIDTDLILLPCTTSSETVETVTDNWAGECLLVEQDLLLSLNQGQITIFGPVFAAESNENSLCVLFERENCAILVTGDRGNVGELLLMQKDLPDVDLLIAGHHGSKYSTSQALLELVQPETVFISVGENNSYGHPAEETLQRLRDFGCEIFRTDENGTLIFRR